MEPPQNTETTELPKDPENAQTTDLRLQEAIGEIVTQAETINVTGDFNIGVPREKNHIDAIGVEQFHTKNYTCPSFTEAVFEQVQESHFLILNGNPNFRKQQFIRHIAWRFSHEKGLTKVLAIDFRSGSEDSLRDILDNQASPCIILVDDLLPNDLQETLPNLHSTAAKNGCYILGITEKPKETWNLVRSEEKEYWFDIPIKGLYQRNVLIQVLDKEISHHRDSLRWAPDFQWEASHDEVQKIKSRTVSGLPTPEQLSIFVFLLRKESGPITHNKYLQVLGASIDTKDSPIRTWVTRAPERNKMLLIAAALFNGLFEEQFFRMADAVISRHWKHRAPELTALDFCDLEDLHYFFGFEHTDQQGWILNSKIDDAELGAIEVMRLGYRRHILACIPIIQEELENSIGNKDYVRARRLRDKLAESLSHLGVYFLPTIKPILESFATSSKTTLQRVAAKAIAGWRAVSAMENMEAVLGEWMNTEDEKYVNRLRQTAALSIFYASDYDTSNQLSPQLIHWLGELYEDPAEQVQRFLEDLLPKMVRNHPDQLAPLLKDKLLMTRDQIHPVAEGLAKAMNFKPRAVRKIIEEWLNMGETSDTGIGHKLTHRDRVFLAAIWAMVRAWPATLRKAFPDINLADFIAQKRLQETQTRVRKELAVAVVETGLAQDLLDIGPLRICLTNNQEQEELSHLVALFEEKLDNSTIPNRHYTPLMNLFQELFSKQENYKIRIRMGNLVLAFMQVAQLDVLEQLFTKCEYVVERESLMEAVAELFDVEGVHIAEKSSKYMNEDILHLLVNWRLRENHPIVRGKLMKLIIPLMAKTNRFDKKVIQKLLADSVFEEQCEILKKYADLILENKIEDPISSLELVSFVIKPVGLTERKTVLELLRPMVIQYAQENRKYALLLLQGFGMRVSFKGRVYISEIIGQIYLDDRAKLKGGNFDIEWKGRIIPIFLGARPETRIEVDMYRFMSSGDNRTRQIGMMAFLEFSKVLDIEEELRKKNPPAKEPPKEPTQTKKTWQERAREADGKFARAERPEPIPQKPVGPKNISEIHIPDQKYKLELPHTVLGWILALFQRADIRPQFWLAVRTFFFAPGYGMDHIHKASQKWAASRNVHVSALGRVVGMFFRWVKRK